MRSLHILALLLLMALAAGCNAPGVPKPGSEVLRPQDQLSFHVLYTRNCSGCHGANGQNGPAMDLANPVYQASVEDASLKRWIGSGMPGTEMPAFAIPAGGTLTDEQIDVIVRGMRAAWMQPASTDGEIPPSLVQTTGGDAGRGRAAYSTYCSSCHQNSTQQVTSPDYLALVSDQYLRTIMIAGRPDIGQPDWRHDKPGQPVGAKDVADILAYLDTQRSQTPGQPYPESQ